MSKKPKETPYSEEGREIHFERTKKKRIQARLDEAFTDKSVWAAIYGKQGMLGNFEYILNRAYALNRDKLKCRVCGGWLIASPPYTHRINPYLPLDKVNSVNNLVSLHRRCFEAVNNPGMDISKFDGKSQKKIIGYREKLIQSHTRNN